jgi:hypothetical protein
MELPQAVLSHHYQDSTHISANVITVGTVIGPATLEASAFHGGEPNEHRWSINGGGIDSWAARFRLQPLRDLDMQVSYARLAEPERTEPGYATRGTASVSYSVPFRRGAWASSVVFGRVYKEAHGQTLNAGLAETSLRVLERHHLSARAEVVDKDELFPHPVLPSVPRPPIAARVFRVRAYTAGYAFDFLTGAVRTGVGANVTWYRFPVILSGFYGEQPHSVYVYLRARLGGSGHSMMHHMDMPM